MRTKKFNYAYDSNIFIDKCQQYGGIWADQGKLEAIAEFAKPDPRIIEIGKGLIKEDNGIKKLNWIVRGLSVLAEFFLS